MTPVLEPELSQRINRLRAVGSDRSLAEARALEADAESARYDYLAGKVDDGEATDAETQEYHSLHAHYGAGSETDAEHAPAPVEDERAGGGFLGRRGR